MQVIEQIKNYILNIRRKELALYIFILFSVLTVITTTTTIFNYREDKYGSSREAWTTNCYRVFVNGKDLGLVETKEIGETAIKQAIDNLSKELGYNPDVKPEVKFFEEFSATKDYEISDDKIFEMQEVIKDGIDVIKVKAYAMRIGEDFVVAVKNKEEIKQVLQKAQQVYVTDDTQFSVSLSTDPYNSMVETPTIIPVKERLDNNRSFTTAAETSASNADNTQKTEASQTQYDSNNGKTISVAFSEKIMVVETYVDSNQVLSVEEATDLITKENQEPQKYTVIEGDCPSTIAAKHDMSLDELTEMNPVLVNNELIQIGDELVVMVPEPELSITTSEEAVYKAPIEKTTTYVDNPDKYIGSNTVLDSGEDGEKIVTAIITKVNGKEVSRTISKEEIIKESKDKVIEKGTKPLPSKAATGTYIMPLTRYSFSSGYGYRWGGFHYGVDLAAPSGTVIRAADGGVVTFAGWSGGYGNLVIISHGNGVTTKYAHCSKISVSVGQKVGQYQEIARVGSTGQSTGSHLHFEIRFDGVPANPMNYLSN